MTKRESTIEIMMRKELERRGILFIPNFKFLRFELDFVVMGKKKPIDIECDGKNWHTTKTQIERDKKRDCELTAMGWDIMRISGTEIMFDVKRCVDFIQTRIDERC